MPRADRSNWGQTTPLRAAADGGGETSPHVSAPPTGEVLVQDAKHQTTLQLSTLAEDEARLADLLGDPGASAQSRTGSSQ